ncbi:uncharacterized protein DMAD_13699 [Drosophila madeirensis]
MDTAHIQLTIHLGLVEEALEWTEERFEQQFGQFGSHFIAAGDWNAKNSWWGNLRACQRGGTLLRSIQRSSCNVLATGSPTHFPYNTLHAPSAIDFAVYKGIRGELLRIHDQNELSSDHLPMFIEIRESPAEMTTKRRLLPAGSNVSTFQSWLDSHIHLNTELRSAEDVDDAADILQNNIIQAAELARSNLMRPVRPRFQAEVPLTNRVRLMIDTKRRLRNLLRKRRDPAA